MSASVGTQQAFNSAILNLDSADPGQYTITLTADIFDDAVIPGGAGVGLYAINLPAGVSLTIVGAGFTLDGLDEGSGIAVLNGKVTIQSLTIEDTVAQGGNGLGSAGGGAGLGGGLFIGSGASVTLQNVTLTNDVARGGDGGPGGFGWVGGNASPILPRSAEATAGSGGAAGAFGGTNSLQVPPIPGGDGGDGQDGENGSAVSFGTTYARGGRGGNGGNGGAGQSSSVAGPGGMGGKGGNAGNGGSGGFGGSGGNGGFGGRGGFSGHSIHLGPNSTLGGTTGIVGGAGGFGGRGGTGGSFGGGGAGGTGGAGGGSENNLADDGSGMGGTGGKGGDGGTGGNGGFGAGGGGGGNGGAGATGGETEGIGGAGGQGGAGGDGGFGGGGGGSGRGGLGGDAGATQNGGPSSGSTGLGGQGDAPGSGGFGGGAGGTAPDAVQGGGGGGGLGAGGDIFVQQGGTLIMDGGLIGVGDAIGGTGGPNAGHGSNWGDSVFIQGFNDFSNFVLEAPAGQILKVTGQIADQSGVGGTGPNAGDGGVTVEGPGTVDMTGDNDFSGPIMLDSGTLEVGQDRDPEALLDFGAPAKLVLQYSAGVVTWDNPIDDFTVGDTIIVNGFVENSFFYLQDDLVMNNGSASATLDVPGLTFSPLHVVGDSINNCTTITVACFAEGTNIATASGDVPVEQLNAGDNVLTHDGRAAPVVWVGRRRIDCTRHPDPHSVWPVRVAAGTFGPGLPARDLYLSPDHAVFVDGVLIPVKYLVDGSNIVQVTTESVTYFHLELPEHGVVLAEGLPAESFFDNGDRDKFENGGGVARLFPEFSAVRREALGCAPLIVCGPIVDAVRDSVARRRQPRIGHVQRAM